MSRENVEVIRRANDAWNRGDLAALETLYAPDVEWRDLQHAPDAPPAVRGIEAVKRIWSDWLDSFGDLRADIEEYIDAGDWVICLVHWHGSGTASGASVDLHSADAFEVHEGKIVRAVFAYKSRGEALQAVGLGE
jgi:ketosteroid isomerase-like protein